MAHPAKAQAALTRAEARPKIYAAETKNDNQSGFMTATFRCAWRGTSLSIGLVSLLLAPIARAEETSIALPTLSLTFTSAYVAEDQGFWAEQGLNVKTVVIQGVGAPNAVISGSVDFTLTTASTFGRAAARGQRMLVIANLLERPMMELVLSKDAAIRGKFNAEAPLADRAKILKGKVIAIDGVATNLHAYAQLVALRGGLDPDKDIQFAPMSATNMPGALQSKAIDGFSSSLPWTVDAVQSGAAVMIASSPRGDLPELIPFNYSVLMTRPQLCADQRAICEKMAHGFVLAAQFIRDNQAGVLAVVKKRFPQTNDDILKAAVDTIRAATPAEPVPTEAGFENSEKFNVTARVMKPEDMLKSFDGLYTADFAH
jgi:NitT/TauT family transport system substrate-binding protein